MGMLPSCSTSHAISKTVLVFWFQPFFVTSAMASTAFLVALNTPASTVSVTSSLATASTAFILLRVSSGLVVSSPMMVPRLSAFSGLVSYSPMAMARSKLHQLTQGDRLKIGDQRSRASHQGRGSLCPPTPPWASRTHRDRSRSWHARRPCPPCEGRRVLTVCRIFTWPGP